MSCVAVVQVNGRYSQSMTHRPIKYNRSIIVTEWLCVGVGETLWLSMSQSGSSHHRCGPPGVGRRRLIKLSSGVTQSQLSDPSSTSSTCVKPRRLHANYPSPTTHRVTLTLMKLVDG